MLISSRSSRSLARSASSSFSRGVCSGRSSFSSSSTSASSFLSSSSSSSSSSPPSPFSSISTGSPLSQTKLSSSSSNPSFSTSPPRTISTSSPSSTSSSSSKHALPAHLYQKGSKPIPSHRPPPPPLKTRLKLVPEVTIPSSSKDVEWNHVHGTVEEGGANAPSKAVFQPGTILEALKGSVRIIGVVLDTVILEERLRLRMLTPAGTIIYPYAESVLFAFSSNSVPLSLVHQTGIVDLEMTPSQTAARSKIVGTLRKILTDSTELRNEVDPVMDEAWEHFRFKGFGEQEEEVRRRRVLVTTAQVAQWVKEETANRRETLRISRGEARKVEKEETELFKELRLHRVYQSMMQKPEQFIAQDTAQWKTEIWRVRSEEDVEEMKTVDEWMKSKNPIISDFITKCQTIIDHIRPLLSAHLASISSSPPSVAPLDSNNSLPTFTESDRIILSHIQSSFLNSKNQRSPFVSTVPTLLKKIDRYGGTVDPRATFQFLVEVGVRTPWDDVGTMFGLIELGERAKEDDGVRELFEELEKKEKMEGKKSGNSSSPSLSTYNSLGPDEFYPSDPLASIRHDFGDLPVYVIDDIEASELDDGVSIERSSKEGHVWIHAHIADPTTLLHPKHRLSRLAAQRASTSYLPQGNYPLLPEEISIERFSLGKNGKLVTGEGQECMTFSAEVNETSGEVVDYKIRAGIIHNINVTTYSTVCQLLGGRRRPTSFPLGSPLVRPPSKPLSEPLPSWTSDLKLLLRTSRAVAFRRLRKGGLNWSLPQFNVKVSPKPLPSLPLHPSSSSVILASGSPTVDYEVQSPATDEASEIVSIAMTLAGNVAGRFFRDRNIPGPYRTYPSPVGTTQDSMAQLLETRDPRTGNVSPFDIARFGVVFLPGTMQSRPGSHWMMGLAEEEGGYVRVTSPLRRYADLIAHWQIKHALLVEENAKGGGGEASSSSSEKALMNDSEMHQAISAADSISSLVQQTQKRSSSFWGAYALSRYARTIDPNLVSNPSPSDDLSSYPPIPTQVFDPLPTPLAGRLGPYRSVILGSSFVDASDQSRSNVSVLIPELGLQFMASHPTTEGPYEPGDEVRTLVDRLDFGPRPGVGGVVFRS